MFFTGKFKTISLEKVSIMIFLLFLMGSILPLSMVKAEPWNPGAPKGPYLSPKWVSWNIAGGGITLLTADVLTDAEHPGEEIFHAGGPVQPNTTTPGRVTCLSGLDGHMIWNQPIFGVGDTATLQMADVNGDGQLEILVALQAPAGLYILNATDGSVLWRPDGIYPETNGYPGYIMPIGGRVDSHSVIGDIDADGYPDIFIGVMAYLEQPDTGKIIHYEWDPAVGTIVERGRVQVWHPCAGGLSLGDTDNDGVFELYMNERSPYALDGGWGRGLMSFWAENLTKRWALYYWDASSEIPMLIDVNKDGIVDIVSSNLNTGICVLNSTDGYPLKNAEGTILYNQSLGVIHNHYQASIYDVDGDSNLELLCADGTFGHSGTQVWDLWSWKLDANITAGYSFRGPNIGEVTGDGLMDIIIVTFDPSMANNGSVQIYNQNFQLLDSFLGLKHRAIGSVVQDIDRNDGGLNELLILTQGGIIYCFDTPGLSQERQGLPRARSEIYFYSESRLGVSEYVPYEREYPDISSPSPSNGAVGVSTGLASLKFTLDHPYNELMNYVVTCTPDIIPGSDTGVDVGKGIRTVPETGFNMGNGVRTVPVSGLTASTTYVWQVEVIDASGHVTKKTYSFTTGPHTPNSSPTQTTPTLSGNTDTVELICTNQSTSDPDGDTVTNIYNWLKNDISIANLILPFDTQPDPKAVYSGTAVTRDYSNWGNNGVVFGATWTQGIVGGAFSFDGDDFIQVEEQSNSLDGGGFWSAMALEFWVKATATGNWKLIWKTDRYNINTALSYEVDFQSSNNQLMFTWGVNTTTAGYNTVSYQTSVAVTDWHHVVCVYKSEVGLIIYFDGVQVETNLNSAITGNVVDTDGPLEIAYYCGSDFIGVLDEVRLYPSQVSELFVNQRYHDTKDGLTNKSTIPATDVVVGDVWRCQVTPNDGLQDGYILMSNGYLFEDGFESGSFSVWHGTTTSTRCSTTVTSIRSLRGHYCGQFTVNSGSTTRRAYTYINYITGLTEVNAYASMSIADGLPLGNEQSMWLIQFLDSSDSVIVSFGIRADNSGTKWAIQYGTAVILASSSIPLPTMNQWYLIRAYYTQSSTGKTIVLTVNGLEVASWSQNTASGNNVGNIRFGLDFYTGNSTATVYIDNVIIDSNVPPQTRYILYVQTIGSGVTNVTTGESYIAGSSFSVKASSNAVFLYWLLDGENVGSANPYVITMKSNHNITAVFEIPQTFLWKSLLTSIPLIVGLPVIIVVTFYSEFKRTKRLPFTARRKH